MRVERPAASTIAAMRRPGLTSIARGCGRVTISMSRAADPHGGDIAGRCHQGKTATGAAQATQSKPFSRGLRAQAGRAQHRVAADRRHQHQIAGIDRHAEVFDRAADRLDGSRNDVAPVRNG